MRYWCMERDDCRESVLTWYQDPQVIGGLSESEKSRIQSFYSVNNNVGSLKLADRKPNLELMRPTVRVMAKKGCSILILIGAWTLF